MICELNRHQGILGNGRKYPWLPLPPNHNCQLLVGYIPTTTTPKPQTPEPKPAETAKRNRQRRTKKGSNTHPTTGVYTHNHKKGCNTHPTHNPQTTNPTAQASPWRAWPVPFPRLSPPPPLPRWAPPVRRWWQLRAPRWWLRRKGESQGNQLAGIQEEPGIREDSP